MPAIPVCQDYYSSPFRLAAARPLHWSPVAAKGQVVEAFGRFLRGRRLARRLSQGQVLLELKKKGVSLSHSALSRYESGTRGKLDPVTLMLLAELYRTDHQCLVSVLLANRQHPDLSDTDVDRILQEVRASDHENAAAAARLAELQAGVEALAADVHARLIDLSDKSRLSDLARSEDTLRESSTAGE